MRAFVVLKARFRLRAVKGGVCMEGYIGLVIVEKDALTIMRFIEDFDSSAVDAK